MRNSASYGPRTRLVLRVGTAVMLASGALTGCGFSSPGKPTSLNTPATQTTSLAPTPTASATPTPTPKPTPRPTRPSQGNGDSAGDTTPATAGGGICTHLSAAEVGGTIGGKLTGTALPGGGCNFAGKNPDSPSASFIETAFSASPGGMDGAKNNATSAVEGTPEDITGVGEAAFVVTGTEFGGDQTQGAGAVKVGNRLINVSVSQNSGLSVSRVRALVIAVLRLAVTKLS